MCFQSDYLVSCVQDKWLREAELGVGVNFKVLSAVALPWPKTSQW